MTTDPERAANTGNTESAEDEDNDSSQHPRTILRRPEVLNTQDHISASRLEVFHYHYVEVSVNSEILKFIFTIDLSYLKYLNV